MARILVTRARPEAEETARALEALAHEVILAPVRITEPAATPFPTNRPDALIATSRNSFAHGGEWPRGWLGLPVYCVGERTAEAARTCGFQMIFPAQGDAASLCQKIATELPRGTRLLYLAGEPRGTGLEDALLAKGFVLEILLRYRMQRIDHLPDAARAALANSACDAVLHFSAESARAFFALAHKADLTTEAAVPLHACLSSAVANAAQEAAGRGLSLMISPKSTEASLVAMLRAHFRDKPA